MKKLAWIFIILLIFIIFSSTACSSENAKKEPEDSGTHQPEEQIHDGLQQSGKPSEDVSLKDQKIKPSKSINANLYFLDKSKNELVPESRQIVVENDEELTTKVIQSLIVGSESPGLENVIPLGIKVNKIDISEEIATVDVSSEFLKADSTLIARAALVNTLTDIEGIKYVKIYVDGNELTSNGKKNGVILGVLGKYSNNLDEIAAKETEKTDIQNDIRQVDLELFFSDCQSMYLLPEVRKVSVKNNEYAWAILDSLIKGPSTAGSGLYPTIPKDTQLLDVKLIKSKDNKSKDGIEVYFSKEFKDNFKGGSAAELTTLGSVVYSVTSLPNIGWVKIYYKSSYGSFIDSPIGNMNLKIPLKRENFANILGRKIKIYFSDKDAMNLLSEYRAINKYDKGIAKRIIEELINGPDPDSASSHFGVIPAGITKDDIKVWVSGQTIMVDLPNKFHIAQLGNRSGIMALYAIVNSLTDPTNTKNIVQVQFLVDGKKIEDLDSVALGDPFVRNPALIKE